MTDASRPSPTRHLRASDLRGLVKLTTQTTAGITRITEGVHQSVLQTLGLPTQRSSGQTKGLTGLIYQGIYGVTAGVAKSIDLALAALSPLFARIDAEKPETPEREAVLAALNGVMGDRLIATDNVLATPMTLRHAGKALNFRRKIMLPGANSHIVVLIHGLCMNDLQWQSGNGNVSYDHGTRLTEVLGATPIHVRYNTGRHTSENGREFSELLEQLVTHWPVPVTTLSIVAHSMGGLVSRGACHYAELSKASWRQRLRHLVFLGTPHHGSPLEKAGNWLDVILGSTAYSAPFARLGQLRSAGITDLRFGHVLDEDWQGRERFRREPDKRIPLPLPSGVSCYAIAATTASRRSPLADRIIGDGLVPLPSALGQHPDVAHELKFAHDAQRIFYSTGHIALLHRADVGAQIAEWLAKTSGRQPKFSASYVRCLSAGEPVP